MFPLRLARQAMRQANWYFDFISPYSYFGLFELERLGSQVSIDYRPVLFAALLNHWGQRGPAEIPGKRTWTYRWCTWYAAQHGIPFKLPHAHPFNPLGYLRLAIAANCDPAAIRQDLRTLVDDRRGCVRCARAGRVGGVARHHARAVSRTRVSKKRLRANYGRGNRARRVRRADARGGR